MLLLNTHQVGVDLVEVVRASGEVLLVPGVGKHEALGLVFLGLRFYVFYAPDQSIENIYLLITIENTVQYLIL